MHTYIGVTHIFIKQSSTPRRRGRGCRREPAGQLPAGRCEAQHQRGDLSLSLFIQSTNIDYSNRPTNTIS